MKAYEVVGYAYEADLHCPDCARKRFGKALLNEDNPPEDNEGNEVHPVFASDFDGDAENCGDCAYPIFDAEDEDEDEEEPEYCGRCDTILDNNDPEGNLCKTCAETRCEYCGQTGHQGGCKAQERHDRRCL